MDEEDGRPGAKAAKSGRADALKDALPPSLRHSSAFLTDGKLPSRLPLTDSSGLQNGRVGEHRLGLYLAPSNQNNMGRRQLAPPQVEEKKNENVPGK
jgi:hypothetical protein